MNRFWNRLPIQEKVMFAKRLAILVRAGIPLFESLQMLKKQTRSRTASRILGKITADVERGQFLAASMASFRNVFGDFAVNVIRIGEMSGTLEGNLNYLAEELQKEQELRRKVMGAMVYPAIVIAATIGLSVLLTVFIFPKILPIFDSFNFELPFTTKVLVVVSNIFLHYGVAILMACAVLVVLFIVLRRVPWFQLFIDGLVLHIPIFGRIAQSYHMANFCRTLGLLLKSQIVVVEATRIAGSTIGNHVYKREIEAIAQSLLRGGNISTHLDTKRGIFPEVLSQMVAVGEATGNLSETLLFTSELYENEMDMLTKNLSTIVEPALMIFMGGIVGFIAISIITPIYEITQQIHI